MNSSVKLPPLQPSPLRPSILMNVTPILPADTRPMRLTAAIEFLRSEASASGYMVEEVRLCLASLTKVLEPRVLISQIPHRLSSTTKSSAILPSLKKQRIDRHYAHPHPHPRHHRLNQPFRKGKHVSFQRTITGSKRTSSGDIIFEPTVQSFRSNAPQSSTVALVPQSTNRQEDNDEKTDNDTKCFKKKSGKYPFQHGDEKHTEGLILLAKLSKGSKMGVEFGRTSEAFKDEMLSKSDVVQSQSLIYSSPTSPISIAPRVFGELDAGGNIVKTDGKLMATNGIYKKGQYVWNRAKYRQKERAIKKVVDKIKLYKRRQAFPICENPFDTSTIGHQQNQLQNSRNQHIMNPSNSATRDRPEQEELHHAECLTDGHHSNGDMNMAECDDHDVNLNVDVAQSADTQPEEEDDIRGGTAEATTETIPESHVLLFLSSVATIARREQAKVIRAALNATEKQNRIEDEKNRKLAVNGNEDVQGGVNDSKTNNAAHDEMELVEQEDNTAMVTNDTCDENENKISSKVRKVHRQNINKGKESQVYEQLQSQSASSSSMPLSRARTGTRSKKITKKNTTSTASSSKSVRHFKCKLCSSSFDRDGHLKVHIMAVHEKKRPFVCGICNASFGHSSSLLRHIRTVHNASPTRQSRRVRGTVASSSNSNGGGVRGSELVSGGSIPVGGDVEVEYVRGGTGDDIKRFKCRACGKGYLSTNLLNRHVTLRHPLATMIINGIIPDYADEDTEEDMDDEEHENENENENDEDFVIGDF